MSGQKKMGDASEHCGSSFFFLIKMSVLRDAAVDGVVVREKKSVHASTDTGDPTRLRTLSIVPMDEAAAVRACSVGRSSPLVESVHEYRALRRLP